MANLSPKQKTLATILAGVVVAVTPSLFTYLQAREEIKAKYRQSNDEATAGYKALVDSVTELQSVVQQQHDYVMKLEGRLEAVERRRIRITAPNVGSGSASPSHENPDASGSGAGAPAPVPPPDPAMLPAPHFRPPPADYNAAQMQR